MSLAPGSQLNGFRLLEQTDQAGNVWKAVDTRLPSVAPVALKLLPLYSDEERATLRRQSSALQRLSHPSLPRYLALVEPTDQPLVGLMSEWVEGEPLSQLVHDARLTESHKQALLAHVIRALARLHAAGVVHHDMRASHVIVTQAFWTSPQRPETVKLIGVAPALPGQPKAPAHAGASAHIAPERLLQNDAYQQHATPRDDVFGLGVMGWVLMSASHPSGAPLDASSMPFMATYQAALNKTLGWPVKGDVEGLWGDVLLACLELDVAKRPQSAQVVADMLDGKTKVPTRPKRLLVALTDDDEAPTTFKPSVIARHSSSPPPPTRPLSPMPMSTHAGARPVTSVRDPLGPHTPTPIEITAQATRTTVHGTTSTGVHTQQVQRSSQLPVTLRQGQAPPARPSAAAKLLVWLGVLVGLALFGGLGVLLGLYLRGR